MTINMDNNEMRALIEVFKEYRDLLNPIQANLNGFIETYELMRENIDRLNSAFGGDSKEKLESIYKNLAGQAEKATDLSARIDGFNKAAARYTADVSRMSSVFGRMEESVNAINELETKASQQLGRLDALLEDKSKNYNVKELQRTLDGYNNNVQKISEFVNKDVAETLSQSQKKLENIRGGIDDIIKKQRGDNVSLDKLLESYQSSSEMLKKIAEKEDVNEAYIFEILDRWAESRKVKAKKKGK